ncbi:hypothetical protein Hypma_001952 [Hypsizygus marmoreus]|uniref:Protein kinase domain-containing protein n=1 Tax=Hypsizygus marmoreus TaxID=39966 RepID=A0A369J5P2_HYPMA|nr:hypothetical protein Hypma_001952 [Hypsizygus marmoreus]
MAQIIVTGAVFDMWCRSPSVTMHRIHPPTSNDIAAASSNTTLHVPCTKDKAPCKHIGHWSIDPTVMLSRSRFLVLRGMLFRPEAENAIDVILKFSRWGEHVDDLIHEADVYENKAVSLQGNIIPRYYGAFQAQLGDKPLTCLVIEYSGHPLSRYFAGCEKRFFWELMRKLNTLHRHGLKHGDFSERNVVNKDGIPFIIDLESVEPHKCERQVLIKMGCARPNKGDVGCFEIQTFIGKLPIWRTEFCRIDNRLISMRSLQTPEDALRIMVQKDYERAKRIVDEIRTYDIPDPLPPFKENPENDDEI